MTWNHRVIRHEEGEESWLGIHECFYDAVGDEIPIMWTSDSIRLINETLEDMIKTLDRIRKCTSKPILTIESDRLVVWDPSLMSHNI